MRFKDSATVRPHFALPFFMFVADSVYNDIVGHDALLTSANDSIHSEKSLHPKNRAWDLRIYVDNNPANKFYESGIVYLLAHGLSTNLGACFDVVIAQDHIHVEFDPKFKTDFSINLM